MGRDISICHPELQQKAEKLVSACRGQGLLYVYLLECFRTVAEQDALYAKGRTAPGSIVTNAKGSSYSSHHQWGTALTFIVMTEQEHTTTMMVFFDLVGTIGVKIGLEWAETGKAQLISHIFSCHTGEAQQLCLKIYTAHQMNLKRHGVMKKWKKFTTGQKKYRSGQDQRFRSFLTRGI